MTRNKSGASTRDRVISGEGGYKSKFMKQYESPVTQQRKTARQQSEDYDDSGGTYGSPGGRRGFVFNGEDLGDPQQQPQQYGSGHEYGVSAPAEKESASSEEQSSCGSSDRC